MAYNPTVWEENDLLSIDRMNKIEQGIAEASVPPDGLLPAGGTTGQMLTKASDNDFDAEWTDIQSGGVQSLDVSDIVITTQEEYDALTETVATTLYLIPEEES